MEPSLRRPLCWFYAYWLLCSFFSSPKFENLWAVVLLIVRSSIRWFIVKVSLYYLPPQRAHLVPRFDSERKPYIFVLFCRTVQMYKYFTAEWCRSKANAASLGSRVEMAIFLFEPIGRFFARILLPTSHSPNPWHRHWEWADVHGHFLRGLCPNRIISKSSGLLFTSTKVFFLKTISLPQAEHQYSS